MPDDRPIFRERGCVLSRSERHVDPSAGVSLGAQSSADGGKTWPVSRTVTSDLAGYSDLAVLPDRTILCIWEGGTQRYHDKISMARFDLNWVLAGD